MQYYLLLIGFLILAFFYYLPQQELMQFLSFAFFLISVFLLGRLSYRSKYIHLVDKLNNLLENKENK